MDKQQILNGKIAVVGLGYVGMPIAVALSEKCETIGFDCNSKKIELYKQGIDPTKEVGNEKLSQCKVRFTDDPSFIKEANFIIVAVPTPVNIDNTPDLSPVEGASKFVGENLAPNTIVCYESTVYPGCTEEICVPILEKYSGLKCGVDFKVAYSPERINPGDKEHRLHNIKKIVSGMDEETLEVVAEIYERIIEVGVHRAQTIKVAEAAKLLENTQRDINIAFMNEMAMAFERMGIRTQDVIDAMNTKWNALGFVPGLVGGHCIGVDPYYFIYKAGLCGYDSEFIIEGRRVNTFVGKFIADNIVKQMVRSGHNVQMAKLYIFGLTFKEDCPDIRNTRVIDIIEELKLYGVTCKVVDPWADPEEVKAVYGIDLVPMSEVKDAECIAFLVKHKEFRELSIPQVKSMFNTKFKNVVIDVKSMYRPEDFDDENYCYWSF